MKKYYLILFLLIGLAFNQTRSVIFNTGSPDSLDYGYIINSNQGLANRIIVQNTYVLEAMVFYMTLQSPTGEVIVSIREDNFGVPGELVSELSQWNHTLDPLSSNPYNLIVTTDLCIYLDPGIYWWSIETEDDTTQATWVHSNYDIYTYATQTNEHWNSEIGYAGAGGVWAEQVYELPFDLGDVNFDFLVNVIDVVNIVGHIMETYILEDDAIEYADINSDGFINVVDVVQIVNIILTESTQNPNFVLDDINPASEFFGQSIGPSFFNGEVSAYYFGKQG